MRNKHVPWSDSKKPFKILMIGNSFCQLYLDELLGMAQAEGIPCRISCVVAGACTLFKHWTWYERKEKHYGMYTYTAEGREGQEGMGLDDCLAQDQWDVISYQDGEHFYRCGGYEEAKNHTEPYLGNLVEYVRGRFPEATHYFHQVWAYQVGYKRENQVYKVSDKAAQETLYRDLRILCLDGCRDHDLLRIPTGDAWQIARADARIGDTMCAKDCEHDGEEQGGRYLNACVWFEVMFGKSCIGNNFRPAYKIPEVKIAALQEAAHKAVTDLRKSEY